MGTGIATGEHRAREAAEKAIACPLLEDINLKGARGILVNISGADIGLAEFNEVGDIVAQFAAEDATIKIGTSVDSDLDDEIKVTVVATGMGLPVMEVKPVKANVRSINNGQVNYDRFDTPAVNRKNPPAATRTTEGRETRFGAQPKQGGDIDYLDIPAFLRRQAD
jgi:cell division protein FtsZ